ncbi:undecaprenyl diphosphate synthase family protein [Halapricum desulfuricans]|uniref:Undecaprenyl pyrophosphate synthase n=1 Tax=Halapricum desulfuricans TaxID=2841257 RepID=A0A897N0P9_9EURY|nr:undecaprenyl diphosphate synthase family protein [Halapricum desulfuricans]QSG06277.1 Undecaprenyl pyrophosphate synthase [Halapricum desulfuricans]
MALYDRYLAARIRWSDASLPESVAVVLTERDLLEKGAYETLERCWRWAFEYGAAHVLVYVSVLDEEVVPTLQRQFGDVDAPRPTAVRGPGDDRQADAPIQVSIGLGGKHEFATAVQGLAEEVADGELDPEDVDESEIEKRLVFPTAPDLVVKTGAERLSDFMIWQSVYSELYFTDVNWRDFRKRDYLRALRDYQTRQRRYGR